MEIPLKLVIAIDDVAPKKNYRIIGEPSEKWFMQLNNDFGCKFSLFVPSNYHNQYPLSKYKSWVSELIDLKFEICCHGHYHMTSDSRRFGEAEFAEINSPSAAKERIDMIVYEWEECGLDARQMGWRNPGWLCTEVSKKEIESTFKYAAIHYEHNQGMKWNIPTFFGHDGIQQTNIGIHNVSEKHPNGMIMFTSHIAGNHNHNVWNEDNYNQLRGSIEFLLQNEQIVIDVGIDSLESSLPLKQQITFNTLNELI